MMAATAEAAAVPARNINPGVVAGTLCRRGRDRRCLSPRMVLFLASAQAILMGIVHLILYHNDVDLELHYRNPSQF